jgi:hypothetical protein
MITSQNMKAITALLVAAGFALAAGQSARSTAADGPEKQAGQGTAKAPAAAAPAAAAAAKDPKADLAPLAIELPKPRIQPTPKNIPLTAHVNEKFDPNRRRQPFPAPKGCVNVARGKAVTVSDNDPIHGEPGQITNGDKEAIQDSFVEFGPGVQWVQIDLGASLPIHAILLWHEHHEQAAVYYDVIIQLSDDKDFITNVRTIFNNDHDNSAGMGIGEDWGYYENFEGKLFPVAGLKARYVRLYSNGNTSDDSNRYTEVEVHALPAGTAGAAAKAPATTTKPTTKPAA